VRPKLRYTNTWEGRLCVYLHAGAFADVAVADGPQHLGGGLALQLPHRRLLLRARVMERKRLLPMAAAGTVSR